MDLLLTHGYFLHEDAKELQIMKPYAPLGLLYLSSHLRARGFDLRLAFEDDPSNHAMYVAEGIPCVYIHSGYYE